MGTVENTEKINKADPQETTSTAFKPQVHIQIQPVGNRVHDCDRSTMKRQVNKMYLSLALP